MTNPPSSDGPFSPLMVTVYTSLATSLATLLTFIIKSYFEGKERKRVQEALLEEAKLRRQWELEDRETKKQATRSADEAKKAACAAARLANETKQEVATSRTERTAQLEEIKAEVKASAAASTEALDKANGHNQKISDIAAIATQALEHVKTTVTMEPVHDPK